MKGQAFGYKNGWIAVKGVEPRAVAEALSLRDVRPAGWAAGLDAAYQDPRLQSMFITPPIDGWVLCVGLPLLCLDASTLGSRLADWAARLATEVQYFATHRVTEAHAWARARPDGLERAFYYVGEIGETVLDYGSPPAEERALGFTDPGEEHVMALAAAWSVDPTSLEERDVGGEDGLLGDFEAPADPRPPGPPPAKKPWWRFW